jgi:superfamily I DNA/RNA helicase
MKSSWWRKKNELVPEQICFINLPSQGRYSLVGPPGSGKTNLLLLRAQFLAGNGEKNVLIITFTNSLCDFIRSGIGKSGHISAGQVMTFHAWAGNYIIDQLGVSKRPKNGNFDENTRAEIIEKLKEANSRRPSEKMYSAIFVDEAQDFSADELQQLLCLSDKICICGDEKQGIYYKDGLSVVDLLKLEKHELTSHFRIGQRIAQVADRLVPPAEGAAGLAAQANYNERLQGKSTAELHSMDSRDEQFAKMVELIGVQLVAFNDDNIGVFAGTNSAIAELKERFDKTELASLVAYHGPEEDGSFSSDARIHVITLHGSKGTEFRAVHIFAAEELHGFPLRRTKLAYTGITRARTALNVFRTGPTSTAIENAFAKPGLIEIDALFEDDA